MAIKLKDDYAKTIPAVTLDKLHIERFALAQSKSDDVTVPRKLDIVAVGRRYGISSDGNSRVFDDSPVQAHSADFDRDFALHLVSEHGYDPETISYKVAQARQDVNSEFQDGSLTREKLFAYVELGLALIFEVTNIFEIQADE